MVIWGKTDLNRFKSRMDDFREKSIEQHQKKKRRLVVNCHTSVALPWVCWHKKMLAIWIVLIMGYTWLCRSLNTQ